MAFTTSFLVKNQAIGQQFAHFVRVTADAASGAFDSNCPAQRAIRCQRRLQGVHQQIIRSDGKQR
jgi:hypothetical protein